MGFKDRITDLAQSLTADPESQDSRTKGAGSWGDGVNYDNPDEAAIEDFRELYRTNPFVRESVRTFVSEVLEPGYDIEADSQDTVDELMEWAEECAIVGGRMDQDLQLLLKQLLIDELIAGSAPIEHVPAEEDEDALAALKAIRAETLKAFKRPGQNILVRPDDVDEDWTEDYPANDDGELAAFVQFHDELGFEDTDENYFTVDDITLLTRDRETGSVWGQSVCKPVKKRAEGVIRKLDDVDQAVKTLGHPHRYVKFGDDEHPWDYETEIQPYMQQYEPGNFEPGQSSGGPADVEIEQYSGEVPTEILDVIKSDVNVIMSAMPIPKYEIGAFEENINQFVSRSQENKQNLQIREARRDLETALTPILKEKAEELELDTAGLRLKVETPEDEGADQGEGGDGGDGDGSGSGDGAGDDLPDTPDDVSADGDGQDTDMTVWDVDLDDADVTDLADPRFVSSEQEYRELREAIAQILQGARDEVLRRLEQQAETITDLAADKESQKLSAQLSSAAQQALQAYLAQASIPEQLKPPIRSVVEKTIDKLASEQSPTLETSFGLKDRQAIQFYTQNAENQVRDATDEMFATIRTQVRRGIEQGEHYRDIRDRIQEQLSDEEIQSRAGLISRMETQNAIQGTRLREYEESGSVVGVKLINPCSPDTTPLCEHLAGCGPREGAVAYFDEGPLSQQWMDHAPKRTLFSSFTPLPSSPPFHWNCRTGMVPLTSREDEDND